MKRFSKGRWNIAGDGTKTLDCGGWSGWYNNLSPALYSTPELYINQFWLEQYYII